MKVKQCQLQCADFWKALQCQLQCADLGKPYSVSCKVQIWESRTVSAARYGLGNVGPCQLHCTDLGMSHSVN